MDDREHRSSIESEDVHKTSSKKFEAKIRTKESGQASAAAGVHKIERATVPAGKEPTHPAVVKSVGHYVERSSPKNKGLRRDRY